MKILKNKQWVFAFAIISSLAVFMPGKAFAGVTPGRWLNYSQVYFPNYFCSATVAFANKAMYIQRCISDQHKTPNGTSTMVTFIYNHSATGNYIGVDDYYLPWQSWTAAAHGSCPLRYFAPYQKIACVVTLYDYISSYYTVKGFSRVWLRGPKISSQDYKWYNSDGYTPLSWIQN
ncbi:MAG: hypothetical protein ABL933_18275 [Methyloglobulus sp.]